MRFVVGLIVGVVLGGGGVYLGLEKPWKKDEVAAAAPAFDAGAVADDGKKKGKRRKGRRRHRKTNADGEVVEYFDEVVTLTPEEKKLSWKGPAVALPPRNIDFEGESGRPLDQSEINSGIAGGKGDIVDCIGDARGNAELSATITVKFLVDGSGNATKVRVQAPNYLLKNGFHGCASRAVKRMRFPATGAPTVVTIPFDLS